jgi:hypothetical protein
LASSMPDPTSHRRDLSRQLGLGSLTALVIGE